MNKSLHAWDNFWQTSEKKQYYSEIGSHDDNLKAFWLHAFEGIISNNKQTKLLDLASGYGYVIQLANIASHSQHNLETYSLDISPSALKKIKLQSPQTHTICANLNSLPFKEASFDLVTSQFGVEYGGFSAFSSMLNLIKPTGELILVCHIKDGAIYQECHNNFLYLDTFINSDFIPLAQIAFQLAYAVEAKEVQEEFFQSADKDFSLSVNKIKTLLKGSPQKPQTLLTIMKIYNDIAYMYQNKHEFEDNEIQKWLKNIQSDMVNYRQRMTSMLNSALNQSKFDALLQLLQSNDFQIKTSQKLYFTKSQELPTAWTIIAKKI